MALKKQRKLGVNEGNDAQIDLFAPAELPESGGRRLEAFKTIYVHFESFDDMRAFGELIEQRLSRLTPDIWFPSLRPEEVA